MEALQVARVGTALSLNPRRHLAEIEGAARHALLDHGGMPIKLIADCMKNPLAHAPK